jgi:lipopolysaccharide transport system ATP-binding protein
MSDTVISVEKLSKRYLVGRRSSDREQYTTLRDVIVREARNFGRKAVDVFRGRQIVQGDEVVEFWALKDVSFEVTRGEVIGIIGKNGAGKSTLLKILSRITEPTAGRVRMRGQIASLLEVGTGFHPELTGRDNIFLNGAILGLSRREIRKKFDEIVAFAEVEKFLDTPVKRYSSGMYVRLAFAVAAHLEPEILIVDEVLAVGDASFQRKCLGKMSQVATELGRTVLFVSHNMIALQAICDRALLLKTGAVFAEGAPDELIRMYLTSASAPSFKIVQLEHHQMRRNSRCPALKCVWLENAKGEKSTTFAMGDTLRVVVQFSADEDMKNPGFGFGFEDEHGQRLFSFNSYMDPRTAFLAEARQGTATLIIERLPLLAGAYHISLSIVQRESEWVDYVERAIQFSVEPYNIYSTGRIPVSSQGFFFADAQVALRLERTTVPA